MPKFFVSPSQVGDSLIRVLGEDVKHITKVLRMSEGEKLTLCDGSGNDYICSIAGIGKDYVECKIADMYRSASEPRLKVTLYQGFPKSDKMEYIIQKCCELGIAKIVPVMTARTVVKWNGESNKTDRFRKVALSAAKQSGRGRVPEITAPVSFNEAVLQMCKMDLAVMPYELEEKKSLKDVVEGKNDICTVGVLIGPEGGFSEAEAEEARANGIETVTLGKRILRCETAGATVLGIIMYEFGEMGA